MRYFFSSSRQLPSFSLAPQTLLFLIFIILGLSVQVQSQTYNCDASTPCTNSACCGISDGETLGVCGFGPDYCGDTCVSNCTATAECGEYASVSGKTCPLNVCCSQYGFCGTTTDFCDSDCQSNCDSPTEPSCSSNDVLKRIIGYYESWSSSRTCDSWRPSDIAVNSLTHINYAFALFDTSGNNDWFVSFSTDETGDTETLINEFIDLKNTNAGLSCYLSIGGWSFNDGDTASYWSDMASTAKGRQSFSNSVLDTLQLYGFDGIDLDWEYPVASDRGGSDDDKANYVTLIREMRAVFDASGQEYGISFTIPASYWYLQNFDVPNMISASGADWANIMTYDLHGVWDGDDPWIGSVVGSHTNLTEIKSALDLLWRNDVDPSKIVLGMGFYGRSFTLSDTDCIDPGCAFSEGGSAGECTETVGILSYKEIAEAIADKDSVIFWDETAAVNYMIFDADQWISFDNNVTFQQKISFANSHCLGGVMIWALDQDTYDWQALSALLDTDIDGSSLLEGGSLSSMDTEELVHAYSAYTGSECYVTGCQDWNTGQCKTGYSVLEYLHSASGLLSNPDDDLCTTGDTINKEDENAQYRLICCPTDAMPESCTWGGSQYKGLCSGGAYDFCGDGKYELVSDSYTERTGAVSCVTNSRSLCCNTNPELELCSWTACGSSCSKTEYAFENTTVYAGTNLNQDTELCDGISEFCCPSEDTYTGCAWYDGDYCTKSCPSDKVLITQRSEIDDTLYEGDYAECLEGYVKLCCDPPSSTSDWPVDPENIFEYPDEDNVSWYYNVEETSNNDAPNDDSQDPFAFVMIDGDASAYDESLVDQWTFLDDDSNLSKRAAKLKKRDIFSVRNDTFDNAVETYHIHCTSLFVNETGCQSIFKDGASNTIVKMPDDKGLGPFARVISLVPYGSSSNFTRRMGLLPRSSDEVYELTVDYDLAAASEEEKGDVNFRIDYTNLLAYWEDVTSSEASKHKKRWFGSVDDWLSKVTEIVKDEKGSLPLEYDDTIKLLHLEKTCSATGIDSTLDLDANIHLGLNAQYAYYFEGSILPTPTLISAYGYFSIEPAAAVLLTLRGEATIQTESDPIEIISGVTFPGLSIKGLISIGPELSLTGSIDTSLSVSGELNVGVSVAWDRAEVYFPRDTAAVDASITPSTLSESAKDYAQTYSVEPSFDATLSAAGNLALTLTPEVKFGISVLGGELMEGYITGGVSNTVSFGVSASVTTGSDGSSAGFCYWADYDYSVYIGANVSFLDDFAYWGDSYELASIDDPLILIEETCQTYSTSGTSDLRKRSTSLVANSTGTPCFGGLISCSNSDSTAACSVDEDTVMDDATDGDSNSDDSDSDFVSEDDTDSNSDDSGDDSDIDMTDETTCYTPPSLFYNCDYFPDTAITNNNENTKAATPTVTYIGICTNIKNYLKANIEDGVVGSNWMELTYLNDANNRKDACKTKTTECGNEKAAMWPLAVQAAAETLGRKNNAVIKMTGYQDSISCDEFPFNASKEGGDKAEVACVPEGQQRYQGKINNIVSNIYDTKVKSKWGNPSKASTAWDNYPRTFTVSLFNYDSSDKYSLGNEAIAGRMDSTSTNNPTENPGTGLQYVLGGVNVHGNPRYTTKNNGYCLVLPKAKRVSTKMVIDMYVIKKCEIIFSSTEDLTRRGLDPRDPDNWTIEDVKISEDDEEESHEISTFDLEAEMLQMFQSFDLSAPI